VVSRQRIWLAGVIGRRVLAEAQMLMVGLAVAVVTIGRPATSPRTTARPRVVRRQRIWRVGMIARRVLAEVPMLMAGLALAAVVTIGRLATSHRTTARLRVPSRQCIWLAEVIGRRELAALRFVVVQAVVSLRTWPLLAMSGRRSLMPAVAL
jgi:hypothetical protein